MRRSRKMLAVVVLCALLGALYHLPAPSGQPESLVPEQGARVVQPTQDAVRPRRVQRNATAPAKAPLPLSETELRTRLAEVGTLWGARTQSALERDAAAQELIQGILRPILENPQNPYAVLRLLTRGVLKERLEQVSVEEFGAVIALGLAGTTYAFPEESDLSIIGDWPDSRAFVEALLRALPEIMPPAQQLFAGMLVTSGRTGGQGLIDASYLGLILELMAAHPDLAELYATLFARMGEGLAAEELEKLANLLLLQTDPDQFMFGLAQLLGKGNDELMVAVAENVYRDPATTQSLRERIAQAIVSSADPDLAATFVSTHAHTSMLFLTQAFVLGNRAGGLDALVTQFHALGDTNPIGRKMIVAGMGKASEEDLLFISGSDPDSNVRGQALTTLTISRGPSPAVLAALETGFRNRGDRATGIQSHWTVLSTTNVALKAQRAGDEELLNRARMLLSKIWRETEREDDRRRALESLKRFSSPAEIEALESSY